MPHAAAQAGKPGVALEGVFDWSHGKAEVSQKEKDVSHATSRGTIWSVAVSLRRFAGRTQLQPLPVALCAGGADCADAGG